MDIEISSDKMKMKWYAIRTQNNKERKVLDAIKSELKWNNMLNLIGDVIIPTDKIIEIKKSKKVEREKIIYPGYVFIQTSSTGEINNVLKTINGCAGFVRTRSGDILPMKQREVDDMIKTVEENNSKSFETIFAKGEEITITEGPFSGFKGEIDSIDLEKGRVKVFVKIFGRPTAVDLTNEQIKKV